MDIDFNFDIRVELLQASFLKDADIHLSILRLDEIHPVVSGNKWFKLKEYIQQYRNGDYESIITFGGAHSNHLVATAAACFYYKIPCKGVVRGWHGKTLETTTLQDCSDFGMELEFVSKADYAQKNELDFLEKIQSKYPKTLIIPEGGSGVLGIKGASSIHDFIEEEYDLICCAIGTGTTFAGIVNGLRPHQKALGFTVMKGGEYLNEVIASQAQNPRWAIHCKYHFGGFAKHNPQLIAFINDFKKQQSIELDFVYNAKMMYGVFDLIQQNKIPQKNVLCLHTGGLQGNNTIKQLLDRPHLQI